VFGGLPGSTIDFTNGLLALAPTGTGVALSLTGDGSGSDILDCSLNGGATVFSVTQLGTTGTIACFGDLTISGRVLDHSASPGLTGSVLTPLLNLSNVVVGVIWTPAFCAWSNLTGTIAITQAIPFNGSTPGTPDTSISRLAAGELAIGAGLVVGDYSGSLKLTNLVLGDFGSVPTSSSGGGTAGTVGQIAQHSGVLYFCSVSGSAGSASWNVVTMTASI